MRSYLAMGEAIPGVFRQCRPRGVNRGEPVVAIGPCCRWLWRRTLPGAPGDRVSDAFADLDVIDGTMGVTSNGVRPKKNFVHSCEHFAAGSLASFQGMFRSSARCTMASRRNGPAGNAGGQRRGIKYSVVNEEHVHARPSLTCLENLERCLRVAVDVASMRRAASLM